MSENYLKIIEEIVSEYNLENDNSEDFELNKKLSEAQSIQEKIFLKMYFDKRSSSKNYSPEKTWASIALLNIIQKLINKQIDIKNLKNYILKKLNVSEKEGDKICKKILSDEYIANEVEKKQEKEENYLGINQELIK